MFIHFMAPLVLKFGFIKNKIDYVNWVELIKFEETRNYVQRVLENMNVYKYMLSQKPVKLEKFFN